MTACQTPSEPEPDKITKLISQIETQYGIHIYRYEDPFVQYDIRNSLNATFDYDESEDEVFFQYLEGLDFVLSKLKEETYKDLPDFYYGHFETWHGVAYHYPNARFVVVNLSNPTDLTHLYFHELFHIFTLEYNNSGKYTVLTTYFQSGFLEKFSWLEEDPKVISEYATTNVIERMAEAFSQSIIRPDDHNGYFELVRKYVYPQLLKQEYIDSLLQ